MKIVKIDPITGQTIATGEYPEGHDLPEHDHEGFLQFAYEGELSQYEFNRETMQLVPNSQFHVIELRRKLALEKRPPTEAELNELKGIGNANI